MARIDIESFIVSFAAVWAARDDDAFLALWRPEGRLYAPPVAGPVLDVELKSLVEA